MADPFDRLTGEVLNALDGRRDDSTFLWALADAAASADRRVRESLHHSRDSLRAGGAGAGYALGAIVAAHDYRAYRRPGLLEAAWRLLRPPSDAALDGLLARARAFRLAVDPGEEPVGIEAIESSLDSDAPDVARLARAVAWFQAVMREGVVQTRAHKNWLLTLLLLARLAALQLSERRDASLTLRLMLDVLDNSDPGAD